MDTTAGTDTNGDSNGSPNRTVHSCVVCGDESDGLHFGQYTRTVSLKLDYSCKHNNQCQIEKNARNMCRACRYAKCLDKGMLTSAVQHARDGLGKRKDKKASPSVAASFGDVPEVKKFESGATSNGSQLNGMPQSNASSTCSSNSNGEQANGGIGLWAKRWPASRKKPFPYVMNNFAQMNLQQLTQQARSAFTPVAPPEMKLLGRMLEGYHHFKSLRKASYTLIEDGPRFQQQECSFPSFLERSRKANYGTSKKICKIEASLLMDTVEKFFVPFSSLPPQEEGHLLQFRLHSFHSTFIVMFSNTERAFRTYKMFPANDDRLLMPDGGYIPTFYENSTFIRGDPLQVARIFENAMHYIVNVVVHHMRQIEVTEMEIIALSGMFLCGEKQSRQQVILDLHAYYRSCGYFDADITLKVANLFLLMPKVEQAFAMMKDDFNLGRSFQSDRERALLQLGGQQACLNDQSGARCPLVPGILFDGRDLQHNP
ncbi:Nuclear hormone receptor family member nhr-28 [Aphelenchoides fujianensis]|nr:Nuclear hormone receptor family member nhr-28 [Aphelenchoides fujianensis]